MSVGHGPRRLAGIAWLALAAAVATPPAGAVEPASGSRNFTAPGDVPNYFSNESGPFHSGANAHVVQPDAAPRLAAPPSRRRLASTVHRHDRGHLMHAGRAHGRSRLARSHAVAHGHVVQAHAARRGAAGVRRVAHAEHGSGRSKAVLATAPRHPAPSKVRHVARVRG